MDLQSHDSRVNLRAESEPLLPQQNSNRVISVILPCLNEKDTIDGCLRVIEATLQRFGILGEVIVADNGSTDGSADLAKRLNVRVLRVARRGYGNTLRAGLAVARGDYFIMGDADDSYNFTQIPQIIDLLRVGNDLVLGNRFAGKIERNAMPWLNRYIGNPVLSSIGRTLYKTNIRDFHCGLRGIRADAYKKLNLQSDGMEFASEMVIKASLAGMRTTEFPTTLRPRAKGSSSHLRPWRDGWRHLSLMLRFRMQSQMKRARSPL